MIAMLLAKAQILNHSFGCDLCLFFIYSKVLLHIRYGFIFLEQDIFAQTHQL